MTEFDEWMQKIETAEKKYENYHNLIKEIRAYYKNEKSKNKQNIFWATVETLKPFLYFKQPKPYIEQKDKINNPIAAVACRILEKALVWNLSKFDFDSVIKYVRNDFLLVGFGLAYEKYVPYFKNLASKGQPVDILDYETVETVYVNPEDFIADSDKVGVWEDCSWVARKIYMRLDEVLNQFGKDAAEALSNAASDEQKSVLVYQIWDKKNKKIIYLSKEFFGQFLKVSDDVFGVDGFFVMPKPLMATLTNDDMIPVPDYVEMKPLLDELDGITSRMQLTMQAIKVSGAYDNSFPELANILKKDVTLVALSDFERLKESGGLKGIMDFAPIEQYVSALNVLALRRSDIVNQIYEMTGVSDIMRGSSNKLETATAIVKKTNFGTMRNQDRQNDMVRFVTDLFKIKAEMICERFSVENLMKFADENVPEKEARAAVELLKAEKLRGMILGIETDHNFLESAEAVETQNTVMMIHNLIRQAFDVVSLQPLLLGIYRQMISTLVLTLPNARPYEPIIEKVFGAIENEMMQKDETPEEGPSLEDKRLNVDADYKKEQLKLKKKELELKQQAENNKVLLSNKEMNLQAMLKLKQLQNKEANVNTNISTGFVKAF